MHRSRYGKKQVDSFFEDSDTGRENGETLRVAVAQVNNMYFRRLGWK